MKKIFLIVSLLIFATQASAWVSKQFIPESVSLITVTVDDQAKDGCWTNIGEVKRYAEDKLELAGFVISRKKFEGYQDRKHYLLGVSIMSRRNGGKCYGLIRLSIFKNSWDNNVGGLLHVGELGGIFSGHDNANQLALRYVNNFIQEVENPQW